MILSASRRTDIPCCYPDWFMNRIRQGYAISRNPMNHAQLSRLPLTPDVVDCIVFWTKDPQPLLPYLDELDQIGYSYYFQFTLTPYGADIEKYVRPKNEIIETFQLLSQRIGKHRLIWRYDPIIFNDYLSVKYHQAQFLSLCEMLGPYTDTVTISFVDLYKKLKQLKLREGTHGEIEELTLYIAKTAADYGITASACCETLDLQKYGILQAKCIDIERIQRICGCELNLRRDPNQRTGCGCCESVDIGAYNTCRNGCSYCYATTRTCRQRALYDPQSPILCDVVRPGENVREKEFHSAKKMQTSFLADFV